MAMRLRIFLGTALLAHCFALAAAAPPSLPPGVAIENPSSRNPLPLGYQAQFLAVDWTNPLLRGDLIDMPAANGGDPPDLRRLEATENDPPLRIELSEPIQKPGGAWALDPPFGPSATALRLAETGGWLPFDPAHADPGAKTCSVLWLGRAEQLASLPSLDFDRRCLFGLIRPETGTSRFVLIERTQPGPGRTGELRKWLQAESFPSDWIALHAAEPGLFTAQGDWRLLSPGDPRRPERAGGVLALRSIRPGEPVDWARLPGIGLSASSSERDFPPTRALDGRIWPALLDPHAWISRPDKENGVPPWIELALGETRQVDRIAIEWASAAGWSKQFNPGLCQLQVAGDSDNAPQTVLEIKSPAESATEWRPAKPLALRRVRLTFPAPTTMPPDLHARVASIQVWGPWNGADGAP